MMFAAMLKLRIAIVKAWYAFAAMRRASLPVIQAGLLE